jgi:peptidase E
MPGPLVILGPQRPAPNLAQVLKHHQVSGRLAVITGGWRHDEDELEALQRDLGASRIVHLPIYQWFDEVHAAEPVLAKAYNARQQKIRLYKQAYKTQLAATMNAVADLQDLVVKDPALFQSELEFTLQALRAIDARTVERVNEIRNEFPAATCPWEYPEARERHARIKDSLAECDALLIAGGHVGVLRNRMYFLGMDLLLGPFVERGGLVAAWSAGAMTLADRILLFYDDPPDGRGEAEILDSGLRLTPGVIWLPHGKRRLRHEDTARMARLAFRLAPHQAVAMENGAWVEHMDGHWRAKGARGEVWMIASNGHFTPISEGQTLALPPPRLSPDVPRVVTP